MVVGSRASFGVMDDSLQRRRQTGRRVVIYGAGDAGVMAVRELMNDAGHNVRIVGFIDDDATKRRNRVRGYPVLGAFDRLSDLVASGDVDSVVLSIRYIDEGRLRTLEALCLRHGIPLSRLTVGLSPLVEPDQGLTGIAGLGSRG